METGMREHKQIHDNERKVLSSAAKKKLWMCEGFSMLCFPKDVEVRHNFIKMENCRAFLPVLFNAEG